MTTEWKRKNTFIKDLRQFLRRFRIVEVTRDVFKELEEVDIPTGGRQYQETGRFVIQIRLTGFWRQR
ncbi:MAG: hypothetical protein WC329_01550 [Candidatus Omnitrophota bacterium]|jgi:hypothetical protein